MTSCPSSPNAPTAFTSVSEELAYYKNQYEQLETELQDFQASSRELESELEKDIEASEQRERLLKSRVEDLSYQVNEWKSKYHQSKVEASNAQAILQKEVTSLREANRTLQLKIRDIEVANDDYERQARHTSSSLEDLEHKYNTSLERCVLFEEEIRIGEQERESLRIQNQRLRNELSDLKVEAEVLSDKLRRVDTGLSTCRSHSCQSSMTSNVAMPCSPDSEASTSLTTASSSRLTSPKIDIIGLSSPPSPPLSNPSNAGSHHARQILQPSSKQDHPSHGLPFRTQSSVSGDRSRAPSHASSLLANSSSNSLLTQFLNTGGPVLINMPKPSKRSHENQSFRPKLATNSSAHSKIDNDLPRSGSLYQIRGLIGKMQKLEARVQNARSKLPATNSNSISPSRSSVRYEPTTAVPNSTTEV